MGFRGHGAGHGDMGFRGHGSIGSVAERRHTFKVRHGDMGAWGLRDMGRDMGTWFGGHWIGFLERRHFKVRHGDKGFRGHGGTWVHGHT